MLGAFILTVLCQRDTLARMKATQRIISPASFRYLLLTLLASMFVTYSRAASNALLPRPQEVTYGNGSLALKGLVIGFASPPNVEDQFAAQQLANGLSAKTQATIRIKKRKVSRGGILLIRTGNGAALPGMNDTTGPDSRESYSIKVMPKGVEIRAPSSAGLFYGVQTLLQMVEGEGRGAVLPLAEVKDWPALAYRGFMMDFSHGQLLRVSEIERQIDLLARFKANQYYFYSEMNVEMEGYELVNPDARYTRAEMQQIIDYARQRHMDVVPCMELYGHMHDLFRVEKFADLGLPHYGDEFDPRNPRMFAVMDDLVAQSAKIFPSPWLHVGFDEPWSLGKIGLTPGKDPFQTFVDVLTHVAGTAQSHGKRLMFWADIANGASTLSNHPELIKNLPGGTIAVPWVYDRETNYARFVEPLSKVNIPTVVAPAIWNWNEIFPDYHHSFYDINGLTDTGRKLGTLGMMNTGWTDCGQTLYRQSLPGLAFGAAAAWQAGPVDTNTFFAEYCALTYRPSVAAEIAPALEQLSTVEEMFESILGNTTMHGFWRDPLEPGYLARLEKRQDDLHKARLLAGSAEEHLLRAQKIAPGDPTLKSMLVAARLFDYLGMKSLYAVEWAGYFREVKTNSDTKIITLYIGIQMNAQDHGMVADLMDKFSGLRAPYREAWLEESTPYRLGTAMARWDAEDQYWIGTWHRLNEILRTHSKDEPFPGIDALRAKH
jgi:hexosaminidase